MTIVKGQIDSLKSIKAELNQQGISRFNSVGDINSFLQSYELEMQGISKQVEHGLDLELDSLEIDLRKFQADYDTLDVFETQRLKCEIDELIARYNLIKARKGNVVIKAIDYIELVILKISRTQLDKNFDRIINKRTLRAAQHVSDTKQELIEKSVNKESVISNRISLKAKDLIHTKKVIDSLYNLIAGAIGENLVVKELMKLSDKNILFNDYSLGFDKPIYNKRKDERIYSVQIDHLLVTNSGIFIIETKNWSKETIKKYDIRSPVQQIIRSSYALFVLLNSSSSLANTLKQHPWGDKEVPIRNLVVLINHKPKEKFKYVAVKTLEEMNRYISYFEPIFDDIEVKGISEQLETLKEQNHLAVKVKHKPRGPGKMRDNKKEMSVKHNLQKWLKNNPGKGLNDYYSKFKK